MSAVQVAGSTIAFQMGLASHLRSIRPRSNKPCLWAIFCRAGVTLIFATDMHYLVIAALHDSYKLFAPGTVPLLGDLAALTTRTFATAFKIGIQLAAPFLVFGLLFNLGLGVLSRLMPQMQVYFVGMPLLIWLGILILLVVLGTVMMAFFGSIETVSCASLRQTSERKRRVADEQQDQEKTEEPTQKRLSDAIEKGNVAKSQEVSTWFVIAGGTLVLMAFAGSMGGPQSKSGRADRRFRHDRGQRAGFVAPCRAVELRGADRDGASIAGADPCGHRRQHDPASTGLVR